MPGRPNFSIGPIVPRAPETTYRFLDYFVAEDADEAWIEESLAFDAQVGAEDRVLIERVQAGMRAGLIEDGPAAAGVREAHRALPGARRRRARVAASSLRPKYLQLVNVPRACGSA